MAEDTKIKVAVEVNDNTESIDCDLCCFDRDACPDWYNGGCDAGVYFILSD